MAFQIGLVQIQNLYSGQLYLPYSAGLIEATARQNPQNLERFLFLPILWQRVTVAEALKRLCTADLVLFSVYVWNQRWSLEVARALKAQNPDIVIVFGGPQVPDRGETFLRLHPFIDLLCHKEGEQIVQPLLDAFPSRDWASVPSASYLEPDGAYRFTGYLPRIQRLEDIPSPYLTGVFESILAEYPGERWLMMLETNRGCPYSCTFCDWGSATQSKLYTFPLERVCAELTWAGEHGIDYIFVCDANFGILPRDLEIVAHAVSVRRTFGAPKTLSVQTAKTRPERIYAVWKALIDGGLNQEAALPLQSVDDDTLSAVKRLNLTLPEFRVLNHRFARDGIRTYSDVILGLPGETYDAFAEGVGQMIEHGQHHRLQFGNLSLLPNAEMASVEQQQKYGLEVITTTMQTTWSEQVGAVLPEPQALVIATAAMPRADWVKARALAWTSILLHCHTLLQVPFILLRVLGNIPFRVLLETFLLESLQVHAQRWPTLMWMAERLEQAAQAIQRGEPEYGQHPLLPGIWLPADDLVLTLLHVEGRLDGFYDEALEGLEHLVTQHSVTLPPGLLRQAVALNAWAVRGPSRAPMIGGLVDVGDHPGGDHTRFSLRYNLWEVCAGYVQGVEVPLEQGDFQVERTQESDFYRRVRPYRKGLETPSYA